METNQPVWISKTETMRKINEELAKQTDQSLSKYATVVDTLPSFKYLSTDMQKSVRNLLTEFNKSDLLHKNLHIEIILNYIHNGCEVYAAGQMIKYGVVIYRGYVDGAAINTVAYLIIKPCDLPVADVDKDNFLSILKYQIPLDHLDKEHRKLFEEWIESYENLQLTDSQCSFILRITKEIKDGSVIVSDDEYRIITKSRIANVVSDRGIPIIAPNGMIVHVIPEDVYRMFILRNPVVVQVEVEQDHNGYPLQSSHICFPTGHVMSVLFSHSNQYSHFVTRRCTRCGHEENDQYDL